MPIRPIDMQVLIPKSQNVSKMSQDMANKSENLLQQAHGKNKKVEEKKLKKVNKFDKKENPLIRNNDKNKFIYSKDRKNKDENHNNENNTTIDIRI